MDDAEVNKSFHQKHGRADEESGEPVPLRENPGNDGTHDKDEPEHHGNFVCTGVAPADKSGGHECADTSLCLFHIFVYILVRPDLAAMTICLARVEEDAVAVRWPLWVP